MTGPVIVVISLMTFLGGYVVGGLGPSCTPSPVEASVTDPSPSLPVETRALSGVWEGSWGEDLPSRVVVESIHPEWATVLIAWGDLPKHTVKSGWMRVRAKVLPDGRIHVAHPVNLTFTLSEDGMDLVGTRGRGDPTASFILRRAGPDTTLSRLVSPHPTE